LDGLKAGPISLGECTKEDWLSKVFPIIQKRIEKYASSEIRFNLMAIIKDRKLVFSEQIADLEKQKNELDSRINHFVPPTTTEAMEVDSSSSSQTTLSLEELQANHSQIIKNIQELNHRIEMEEDKFRNWKVENIRRKHNYIPFFVNLLKILAEKGELVPLIQRASRKS